MREGDGATVILRPRRRDESGFTLVELAVIMVVISALVTMAVVSYVVSVRQAYKVACKSNQRMLSEALIQYEAEHNGALPATIDELAPWVLDINQIKTCPADRNLEMQMGDMTVYCVDPSH